MYFHVAPFVFALKGDTPSSTFPGLQKAKPVQDIDTEIQIEHCSSLPAVHFNVVTNTGRYQCHEHGDLLYWTISYGEEGQGSRACYNHRQGRYSIQYTENPKSLATGVPPAWHTPLLYLILSHFVHQRGGLLFHGALLRFQKNVFALCGPSGVGKSTTAGWCERLGAQILAEDRFMLYGGFGTPLPWGSQSKNQRSTTRFPLNVIIGLFREEKKALENLSGAAAVALWYRIAVGHLWPKELRHNFRDTVLAESPNITTLRASLHFSPNEGQKILNGVLGNCVGRT